MEMLLVIAIIGVLVGTAIPTLNGQIERAKVATDEANARAGYAAVLAQSLFDDASTTKTYVFDAASGRAVDVTDNAVLSYSGYGKSSEMADYSIGNVPVRGYPEGKFLTYRVRNGQVTSIVWLNGSGAKYTEAESLYNNKTQPLPTTSAEERLYADVDAMRAMGEKFLGMTREEILDVTNTPSAYQGRLSNGEGITLLTYRNNSTDGSNPEIRGDYSVLQELGFSGLVSESFPNSFSGTSSRAFFSDYMNSGIEAQIQLGKVEFNAAGKATKVEVCVRQWEKSGTVPDEMTNIVVAL